MGSPPAEVPVGALAEADDVLVAAAADVAAASTLTPPMHSVALK